MAAQCTVRATRSLRSVTEYPSVCGASAVELGVLDDIGRVHMFIYNVGQDLLGSVFGWRLEMYNLLEYKRPV